MLLCPPEFWKRHGEMTSFSTNVSGKTGCLHAENWNEIHVIHPEQISIQRGLNTLVQNLNLKTTAGKSREYTGIYSHINNFLNSTSVVQQLRERIDKCEYMKLKTFCTAKEMVTIFNSQSTEWEKILNIFHLYIW
jgi:hypothetical protein